MNVKRSKPSLQGALSYQLNLFNNHLNVTMNRQTYVLPALAMFLAVGCSTTPISTQEALPVPSDRLFDEGKRFSAQAPNTGYVVVKRDSGIMGSACSTRIYVDGKPVGDIDPSEKMGLYLPEGEHILSAQPNGVCSGTMTEVHTTVRAGSQSAFRFGTSGNGSPSIYPTAF